MERALPPLARPLTEDDMAVVEDVLDAADAWSRGELPWHVAAGVGTLVDWSGQPRPSYSRYVAYRVASRDDPRVQALGALIEVIITMSGYRITRQGVYTAAEIRANDAGWQGANLERSTR